MRVLVLGGTADGRELCAVLRTAGHEVVESVAGRTAQAREAAGARVGGFGGASGLADYLRSAQIAAVVDATHPFAAQMSSNAALAGGQAGVPVLRLARPGWRDHELADQWVWVPDHSGAAQQAARHSGLVLLTVGRQPLPAYHDLPAVLARVAEWQDAAIPAGWRVLEARGPFSLAAELELLGSEQIAALVSKDSGGTHTAAKLDAAHQLGVPVIMVARPELPSGVTEVATHAGVVDWLAAVHVTG